MPYCSQTLNGILLKRNTGFQSKKTLQLWLRWSDVKDPSKIVILILLSFQGPCWEIWEVCLNYSNWHFIGSRHPFVKKKNLQRFFLKFLYLTVFIFWELVLLNSWELVLFIELKFISSSISSSSFQQAN